MTMKRKIRVDHNNSVHEFLALVGNVGVLSLGGLWQPVDLIVPDVNVMTVGADLVYHICNGPAVAPSTKCNNLLMKLAVIYMCHACVGREGRRGMGNVVIFAAEVEVECTHAPIVRGLQGCDGEAKDRGKVLVELGNLVAV